MPSAYAIQDDVLPEQILQAALNLYQKYGLKKVTMEDVSKAIGKSRSALYYYYKNRDEIFEAVMDAIIKEVADEITHAINLADSMEDKIRAFCLTKIKTSQDRKSIFQAMEAGMDADEISRHGRIMGELHHGMIKAETALLKNVLSESERDGSIRSLKPKERGMIIFILLSSVRGIKREMAHENDFSRLGMAVDTLTEMVMKWLQD